jgi:hypothetical protein
VFLPVLKKRVLSCSGKLSGALKVHSSNDKEKESEDEI